MSQTTQEAVTLTNTQFQSLLEEIEKIPSYKSPINGKTARLCFEFMEDTGCRVNETIHVMKKDLDFKTRVLTVTQPKSEKQCKCSRWIYKDQYTRARILEHANPKCPTCHGRGKWKKPQFTTFTHRIMDQLKTYYDTLQDNDLLFPVSRQSLWKWGKKAGVNAGIDIFQYKDEKKIEGIFLHMFRAMCSLRMVRDAKDDKYTDALVARKLRHAVRFVTDRYTKVDINYLLTWENRTYNYTPSVV